MATSENRDGSPEKTALETAREKAEARRANVKKKAEERELEALNVAEELTPKYGEQGVKFDVIQTDVGVFAVKCPEFTTAKVFNALPADKRGDEEVFQFVSKCVVYPDQNTYRGVAQEHGGLNWRLAGAMLAMYEGSAQSRMGKF